MLRKIGVKLVIAVAVTAVIVIGIYAYINIQSQSKVLLDEVERHAQQLSETVKKSTKFDMLANRREHIYNIINTIGEEECIREVRVLNKEGMIMYSADEGDIGKMMDMNAEACYACHAKNQPLERLSVEERTRIYRLHPDSSRILGIINPIYNEPSCYEAECHAHSPEQKVLGVLDITMGLQQVDESIQKSQFNILGFTIVAIILLSLILGYLVRRWISRPVHNLVNATNHVAQGNLDYTVGVNGKDELGQLSASFDNMTKKLSEARMQLVQSDKMASLGRLAAGVAHEINNPLTGVLTYSSFLLKRTKDQPAIQEDLRVIVRETKRSREIVKSLLDFARQSVPKKNKVQINEIIENSLKVVDNQLTLNRIKLDKDYGKNLPQLTADANQLQQVFINLVVNASDAIGAKGGKIRIATSLIKLEPYGITQVKNCVCPKGHSLIDSEHRIGTAPAIKVKVKEGSKEGIVYIDPVYGKNRDEYGIKIDDPSAVDVQCPKCRISLVKQDKKCPDSNSVVYALEVPGEGFFEGCIDPECNWQYWDAAEKTGKRDYIEAVVADNGCGIDKESLSKIFEPFYTTKGQKGTGLGLAVIWGIVDNHDGTINVDSEKGKGTEFTIRLPIEQRR